MLENGWILALKDAPWEQEQTCECKNCGREIKEDDAIWLDNRPFCSEDCVYEWGIDNFDDILDWIAEDMSRVKGVMDLWCENSGLSVESESRCDWGWELFLEFAEKHEWTSSYSQLRATTRELIYEFAERNWQSYVAFLQSRYS